MCPQGVKADTTFQSLRSLLSHSLALLQIQLSFQAFSLLPKQPTLSLFLYPFLFNVVPLFIMLPAQCSSRTVSLRTWNTWTLIHNGFQLLLVNESGSGWTSGVTYTHCFSLTQSPSPETAGTKWIKTRLGWAEKMHKSRQYLMFSCEHHADNTHIKHVILNN